MLKAFSEKARYNYPGHAHVLTYSCYRRRRLFNDSELCSMFLEKLESAKHQSGFLIWAYVLMPNHVHLLIWPQSPKYDVAKIQKDINGPVSRRYSKHLQMSNPRKWHQLLVQAKGKPTFRLFQPGGGYDRNLWKALAIHDTIAYIENNPVRLQLVKRAKEWPWSSAQARASGKGLVPDLFKIPVLLK